MPEDAAISDLLNRGVAEGVYPGAVLLVSVRGTMRFFRSVGWRSLVPRRAPMEADTIFDLASLTKPLATSLAAMRLVDEGRMHLDQPLADSLPQALPEDKKPITLRMLLSHSAGFPAWKPYYLDLIRHEGNVRKAVLRQRVLRERLLYPPGKGTLYSDLGFMALEWVIESLCGTGLCAFLERHFYAPLSSNRMFLWSEAGAGRYAREQYAATEDCPWRKRVLQGEVHDENAYAAGGHSGHAGLFGTAEDVCVLAELLKSHHDGKRDDYLRPETVRAFFAPGGGHACGTWALGWDRPSQRDSSAGRFFSGNSVGHLGFTGTSLWMDLDKDVIVVFLTNRVHPTRSNERIKAFRPAIHDEVMRSCGLDAG